MCASQSLVRQLARTFAVVAGFMAPGCSGDDASNTSRSSRGEPVVAGSGAPTSADLAEKSNPSAPLVTPQASAPGGSSTTSISACAPGTYKGTYDIGLLGMGPITFVLVPGPQTASTGKCEEFCPDLVLSSEGGEFYAAWIGFVGRAKLTGGLDCRTGEFRAEMVDGKFGLNFDPNGDPAATLLDAGTMTGRFVGRFSASGLPKIAGDIMCNAGPDINVPGTFDVMRAP